MSKNKLRNICSKYFNYTSEDMATLETLFDSILLEVEDNYDGMISEYDLCDIIDGALYEADKVA
jgi:Ca2+-binding EF-hand superfamily protein